MNHFNCIVAQSGGPTAAINASLAGVISAVMESDKYDICYGAIHGILGICVYVAEGGLSWLVFLGFVPMSGGCHCCYPRKRGIYANL